MLFALPKKIVPKKKKRSKTEALRGQGGKIEWDKKNGSPSERERRFNQGVPVETRKSKNMNWGVSQKKAE